MRRRLFWTLMALNLLLTCGWWVVGLGTSNAWIAAMDARRSCELRIEATMEGRPDVANAFVDRTVVTADLVLVELSWRDLDGLTHEDTGECRVSFGEESATIERVTLP